MGLSRAAPAAQLKLAFSYDFHPISTQSDSSRRSIGREHGCLLTCAVRRKMCIFRYIRFRKISLIFI